MFEDVRNVIFGVFLNVLVNIPNDVNGSLMNKRMLSHRSFERIVIHPTF